MKNLNELLSLDREVAAISLFKGVLGTATAIKLDRNGTLKEHITKTPALLLWVDGRVTYEDENQHEFTLETGDYVNITPNVKHWLYASVESQLILLK